MATDPDTANAEEDIVEPTSPFVVYAPLILATISALGFVVTVGVLIFSRVFRLGKFFAEFTALRETVDDLQETVASNKVELEQAIADNRTELQQAIADNRTELQQAELQTTGPLLTTGPSCSRPLPTTGRKLTSCGRKCEKGSPERMPG